MSTPPTARCAPGQRLLTGRALSVGEVQALFHVCAQDESVKGSRDAALIAVLYSAGLRRSEAVGVQADCYVFMSA